MTSFLILKTKSRDTIPLIKHVRQKQTTQTSKHQQQKAATPKQSNQQTKKKLEPYLKVIKIIFTITVTRLLLSTS